MNGFCYIDNHDIFSYFGVIIAEIGYNNFLTFPPMAEPDKNDWAEHNGVEVDLSVPRLQPREISVPFARIGGGFAFFGFWGLVSAPGYRTISIPPLGRSWNVRVTQMPTLETYHGADVFNIRFIEDAPIIPTGYPMANADIGFPCAVSLDGKTLDRYGIIITGGLDEIERAPSLKQMLTRSNSRISGQIYDVDFVRFAEKEITLGCCLTAPRIEVFWNLYDAFFGDLLKPNERVIRYKNRNYSAYYRRSSNFQLHSHAHEVVCEFDITMVITSEI